MSPQPIPAKPDAQRYGDVLHELIGMGMDLARIVHQHAAACAIDPAEATIAFDRIARSVRRSVALARSLDHPVHHPGHYPVPGDHRVAARRLILRGVEDAIERHAGSDADSVHEALLERLDSADLDDDIAARPAADIITDICRDLGLVAQRGPIWKRRNQAEVALLHARAAAPVSRGWDCAAVAALDRRRSSPQRQVPP